MRITSKNKRIIAGIISVILVLSMVLGTIVTALADETKILTLGADLTDEQKQLIIDYLGVDTNSVDVITVNNQDEHQYLGGVLPDQKIGKHTYSCCYIEPTSEGGIHIKTVNLNYVDSDMIRNALITSGINNANVVCVSPKPVSGTGAMVGVFMAYRSIDPKRLSTKKVEIASEELVTTVELSKEVGKEEASNMMNELKQQVIEKSKTLDMDSILDMVDNYVTVHQLNLTEDQKWKIADILLKIAQQDYDINKVRQSYQDTKEKIETLEENAEKAKNIIEKIFDFFTVLWQKITGTYEQVKEDERVKMIQEQIGILADTNDKLLGDKTVVTNTEDSSILNEVKNTEEESQDDNKGFIQSIVDFFSSKSDSETDTTQEKANKPDKNSITFDSFNNSNSKQDGSNNKAIDSDKISEKETKKSNLDYVTHELQDLDTSKQDKQQNNSSTENSAKTFDELTN